MQRSPRTGQAHGFRNRAVSAHNADEVHFRSGVGISVCGVCMPRMRNPVVRFDHAPRTEKAIFCDHCETCIYAQRQVVLFGTDLSCAFYHHHHRLPALTQSRTMRTFIPLLALPVSLAASIVGRAAISYNAQSGTKSSQIDAAPVGIRSVGFTWGLPLDGRVRTYERSTLASNSLRFPNT